jgi:hypothetical protein
MKVIGTERKSSTLEESQPMKIQEKSTPSPTHV